MRTASAHTKLAVRKRPPCDLTPTHMCECVRARTLLHLSVVRARVCVCSRARAHTHARKHTRTHARTHTHTHTADPRRAALGFGGCLGHLRRQMALVRRNYGHAASGAALGMFGAGATLLAFTHSCATASIRVLGCRRGGPITSRPCAARGGALRRAPLLGVRGTNRTDKATTPHTHKDEGLLRVCLRACNASYDGYAWAARGGGLRTVLIVVCGPNIL